MQKDFQLFQFRNRYECMDVTWVFFLGKAYCKICTFSIHYWSFFLRKTLIYTKYQEGRRCASKCFLNLNDFENLNDTEIQIFLSN